MRAIKHNQSGEEILWSNNDIKKHNWKLANLELCKSHIMEHHTQFLLQIRSLQEQSNFSSHKLLL